MSNIIKKNVLFHKIDYKFPTMANNNYSDEQLKEIIINQLKKHHNDHELVSVSEENNPNNVIIETLAVDDNYLFGILGKQQDIANNKAYLITYRDKENMEVLDKDETNKIPVLVETFTYFVVEFNRMKCAVMYNSDAPSFPGYFRNFLINVVNGDDDIVHNTLGLSNVLINRCFNHQLEYELGKTQEIDSINLIFHESSNLVDETVSLDNIFNITQSNIISGSIKLKFEGTPMTDKTRNLLLQNDDIADQFNKFEVSGIGDDDEPYYMEFVNNYLTKSVKINIDADYLKGRTYHDEIRKILIGSFTV